MTAAVFLENSPDLNREVVIQRSDVRAASTTYLRANDVLHWQTTLLTAAAALPPGGPQINPDDPYFIAPEGNAKVSVTPISANTTTALLAIRGRCRSDFRGRSFSLVSP